MALLSIFVRAEHMQGSRPLVADKCATSNKTRVLSVTFKYFRFTEKTFSWPLGLLETRV